MSGAGKTQAIRALEDLGYFCVDNLPSTLIPTMAELASRADTGLEKVAIVADVRESGFLKEFPRVFRRLKTLPGRPVFVAYPTAFDFPFVHFYLAEFVGENPFGYSAIDIKTYSMALLRKPYRMCGKRSMPVEWLDPVPHTHVALDDAIEQGRLFCNMLKANRPRAGPRAWASSTGSFTTSSDMARVLVRLARHFDSTRTSL